MEEKKYLQIKNGYNMKKLIIVFSLFFPVISFAKTDNIGYWSVKCGGFGGSIEIKSSDITNINVNDNNLYISAHLEEGANGKTEIIYNNVIESMNEEIIWPDISQKKPIAEMLVRNGFLYLTWKGFFDTKKNYYVWTKEPDFIIASDGKMNVEMKKCSFE